MNSINKKLIDKVGEKRSFLNDPDLQSDKNSPDFTFLIQELLNRFTLTLDIY